MERHRDRYVLSDDANRLDVALIWRFLSDDAYGSIDIPREVVERSIRNSLNFGVYDEGNGEQVAFTRVEQWLHAPRFSGAVDGDPARCGGALSRLMLLTRRSGVMPSTRLDALVLDRRMCEGVYDVTGVV